MKLTLIRTESTDKSTLGSIYINDEWFCWTCEDPVRDHKIKGETAIPIGTYNISLTYSPRFKKIMPLLESVPGFEGIRIHPGNTPADTEGCILVGLDKKDNGILRSRLAYDALFLAMQTAESRDEPITITIT